MTICVFKQNLFEKYYELAKITFYRNTIRNNIIYTNKDVYPLFFIFTVCLSLMTHPEGIPRHCERVYILYSHFFKVLSKKALFYLKHMTNFMFIHFFQAFELL